MAKEYYDKKGNRIIGWFRVGTRRIPLVDIDRPEILPPDVFDEKAKSKQIIYRGLKDNVEMGMTVEDILDDTLSDSEIYQGHHAHGYGIYFTTKQSKASSQYARDDKSIITAFLNDKSVIRTELDLVRQYEQEIGRYTDNRVLRDYALSIGCNVIHVPGGASTESRGVESLGEKGEDYYIALKKNVLTIRDNWGRK